MDSLDETAPKVYYINRFACVHKNHLCYIGDNITDLETAYNLGCLGFGVNTGLNNLFDLVKKSKMNFKVYNDIESLFKIEFKNSR